MNSILIPYSNGYNSFFLAYQLIHLLCAYMCVVFTGISFSKNSLYLYLWAVELILSFSFTLNWNAIYKLNIFFSAKWFISKMVSARFLNPYYFLVVHHGVLSPIFIIIIIYNIFELSPYLAEQVFHCKPYWVW